MERLRIAFQRVVSASLHTDGKISNGMAARSCVYVCVCEIGRESIPVCLCRVACDRVSLDPRIVWKPLCMLDPYQQSILISPALFHSVSAPKLLVPSSWTQSGAVISFLPIKGAPFTQSSTNWSLESIEVPYEYYNSIEVILLT